MPQSPQEAFDGDEIQNPISQPGIFLVKTAHSLSAGRVPRARRPLRGIIEAAIASSDLERATLALTLLTKLELRRNQPQLAVSAASWALELSRRSAPVTELERALNLAAVTACAAENFPEAARLTDEWLALARARGDERSTIHALLRRSYNLWSEGLRVQAIETVETALPSLDGPGSEGERLLVERVLSGMLLRLECTAAAHRVATAALKRTAPCSKGELYEERGWMELRLENPAAAGRNFRRARKEYRDDPDLRIAMRLSCYTAAADALKYRGKDPAREEKALGAIQRLELSAARFTDLGLVAAHAAAEAAAVANAPREPAADAARRIGTLGRSTSSLLLLRACKRELTRLSRLNPTASHLPTSPMPPLPGLGFG